MTWLVDGSNVLGALRWNRETRESKERLATLCARFARRTRKRVILCFDGSAPSGFARKLGGLSVRFSHPRSADEVIVELARDSNPCSVVTSDQGIAGRVRRRTVDVVPSGEFGSRLLALLNQPDDDGESDSPPGENWDDYFSDPKNRIF